MGAGDQNAAAVGAGIVREGIASVSIGTGGMAIQLLRHPYRDPAGKICVGAHALYGNWQVEGYQTGAAGVFRWFRDTMAQWEKHQAGLAGEGVYERLDALAAQTPPGADGLVLLPYFASSAAPRWNANARGTLMGLTFAHGMGHLARAFMEGIALEQKDILRSMERAGGRVARIRLTGGASKSPLWCQIQADMYGVPVETLQMSDTALAGAAVFAGVGAGLFGSVEQGVARMVHPSATFSPNAQTVTRYERLYGAYDRAVLALEQSGVFDEIAALQREGDTI